MSRTTIHAGLKELGEKQRGPEGSSRKSGGGRKALTSVDPLLVRALDALVEPVTRGDPQSPLRWTCKSTANLAAELTSQRHPVSARTVARILKGQKYSLQANRKTREGRQHPDRNAQFEYINRQVKTALRRGQPAISVDTKKKEKIGSFKNEGREWRRRGRPVEVSVHDFIDPEKGKVVPYGVYDLAANNGWVSVGIDHDTADFAVASIYRWWTRMGRRRYPRATHLTVTADSGGSNSSRTRAWKVALQRFANRTGLAVTVHHYPPGTSKWNKIEHRMFCHITRNWRAHPLVTRQAVVELIGRTTTRTGLTIRAELDTNPYPKGVKISEEELAAVCIRPGRFHGDWNYAIIPTK